MQFGKDDYEAVAAAIGAAEKKTSGQIVCVLAHSSSGYVHVPILWADALALFTPWPLIDFTHWSVQRIFLLQLVVFIVAGLVFSWMPLRLLLVPRAVQRARAHRAAIEQFVVRGISRTKNRTGVLIFVSLAEHYARIIADDGIAAKVQTSRMAGRNRCADGAYARRPDRRGLYGRDRALRRGPGSARAARRVAQRASGSAICHVSGIRAARTSPDCHQTIIMEPRVYRAWS